MANVYTLREAAVNLQLSTQSIHKAVKRSCQLLVNHLSTNEAGVKVLDIEGLEILRGLVHGKAQIQQLTTTGPELTTQLSAHVAALERSIEDKTQLISRLMDRIDADAQQQAQERQRTDTILMSMTRELEAVRRLQIEHKVDALVEPGPAPAVQVHDQRTAPLDFTLANFEAVLETEAAAIRATEAPRVKIIEQPAPALTWMERTIYQLFTPWKLRREA